MSGTDLDFIDGCKVNRLGSTFVEKLLLKYWCPLLVYLSCSFNCSCYIFRYQSWLRTLGLFYGHTVNGHTPKVLYWEVILSHLDILLSLDFHLGSVGE